MKIFQISVKFEQNGRWSEQESDCLGYLVQKRVDSQIVEGYVEVKYPTASDKIRFIKGLYVGDSLVFIQLSTDSWMAPICYCFPDVREQGFWSSYDTMFGFFSGCPGSPYADGHAKVTVTEVTGENRNELGKKATEVFKQKASNSRFYSLLEDVHSLKNFLDPEALFQMQLHCGKW